jgi:hypothetical protein
MGKSLMQLAFAQNVIERENKPVLILTPLAVGAQTVKEAAKFGIEAERSLDGKHSGARVVVANYERLHLFDPTDFAGTICDESSILKNFSGATKTQVTRFMNKQKFRLLCTATAAPNDFIELGTSSEALGHMPYMDMLKTFFKSDSNTYAAGGNSGGGARRWAGEQMFGGKYRFRGHAERDFSVQNTNFYETPMKTHRRAFLLTFFALSPEDKSDLFIRHGLTGENQTATHLWGAIS